MKGGSERITQLAAAAEQYAPFTRVGQQAKHASLDMPNVVHGCMLQCLHTHQLIYCCFLHLQMP